MARKVDSNVKSRILEMIVEAKLSQRDIEKETGVSRQYIRKLAKELGHQFPRNGVEIASISCICANCGKEFKRPPSKANRAKNRFCNLLCKESYFQGKKNG